MLVTRIKALLGQKKISPADFARGMGVEAYVVSKWLNGKVKMSIEDLLATSKLLGVTVDYLLGSSSHGANWAVLPILGEVPAGNPIEATECHEGNFSLPAHIAKRVDFGLRVKGESMIDAGILPGDIVFVKCQPVAENRQIVVAKIDGEATIKRYFKADHTVVLRPENSTMELTLVTPDRAFQIVGIVTGLWRPEIK